MCEFRGKVQSVIHMKQIFNPMLVVMNDWVLCYNKYKDPTKPYNALHICLPETRLKEAFQICHEGITSRHGGVVDTLDKFQRTNFFYQLETRLEDYWNIGISALQREK